MDTLARSTLKAVTWQVSGLVMMMIIGFILTGSVSVAGQFAVISSGIGFVSYVLHENIWARISWGQRR